MILAADIGGTTARFRLADEPGVQPLAARDAEFSVAGYASFDDALAKFIEGSGALAARPGAIKAACIAVAGPVAEGRARLTNGVWAFDEAAIAARFGIDRVVLVNDLEASACGIEELDPSSFRTLQRGALVATAPRLIIGAGTGLGVAYSVCCSDGRRVVAGEGGHIGFAPANEDQIALWHFLHERLGRVSVEHVVSGPGLLRLYAFARETSGEGTGALPRDVADEGTAAVVQRARAGDDLAACRAIDLFIACYGAVAGDYALAVLARGGVYVTGGIAPKVLDRRLADGFLAAFRNKGVHGGLMQQFPLHVVVDERIGLSGAASLARRAAAAA